MNGKKVMLTIQGEKKEYPAGTSFLRIAQDYSDAYQDDIVLVLYNRRLRELNKCADGDGTVEFLTTADKTGKKAYRRSVTLLMQKAVYNLWGKGNISVRVKYSIGQGNYCELVKWENDTEEVVKSVIRHILSVAVLFCLISGVQAQSVKVNIPFWLTGSPNVGFEYTLTRQLTVNGEVLWMPYLFKKHEEVFRALQSSVELRYYVNPRNFYTNDSWDGFYIGPYAMYGNFNIGLLKHNDPLQSYRRKGWGVSGGISTGYKFAFNSRWGLDLNIGLGYAHLQYNKYYLGGEYVNFPLERKKTKRWIGPTKFGINLTYNIFR